MRTISGKNRSHLISIFLNQISKGQRDGSEADGKYLADHTKDLKQRSLHMNAGEVSNFVKRWMLNVNFFDRCVVASKKNKNNGGNIYKMVDLNA